MAVKSALFTLSTTPTLVATAQGSNPRDRSAVLISEASANVYVGGSDVDSTDGTLVEAGSSLSIDLSVGDDLYVVAGAGTPTIKVLTTRTAYVAPA